MKTFAVNHLTPGSFRFFGTVLFLLAFLVLWEKYRIVAGGQKLGGRISGVRTLMATYRRGWHHEYEYTVEAGGLELTVLREKWHLRKRKRGESCTVYYNPRRRYAVFADDYFPEVKGAVLIIFGLLLWM